MKRVASGTPQCVRTNVYKILSHFPTFQINSRFSTFPLGMILYFCLNARPKWVCPQGSQTLKIGIVVTIAATVTVAMFLLASVRKQIECGLCWCMWIVEGPRIAKGEHTELEAGPEASKSLTGYDSAESRAAASMQKMQTACPGVVRGSVTLRSLAIKCTTV